VSWSEFAAGTLRAQPLKPLRICSFVNTYLNTHESIRGQGEAREIPSRNVSSAALGLLILLERPCASEESFNGHRIGGWHWFRYGGDQETPQHCHRPLPYVWVPQRLFRCRRLREVLPAVGVRELLAIPARSSRVRETVFSRRVREGSEVFESCW